MGAEIGTGVGAGVGALTSGAGEAITIPVGTASGTLIGGLIAAHYASEAAQEGLEKLGHYNATIKSLNDAAARHPNFDAAGNLLGGLATGGPQIARSFRGYSQAAGAASRRILQQGGSEAAARGAAARAVAGKVAGQTAGAAAVEAFVRPAVDTALYHAERAFGLDPQAPQPPTLSSILQNAGLAILFAGGNPSRPPTAVDAAIARLMARGQARTALGIPLASNAPAHQAAVAQYLAEAGLPLTPQNISQYTRGLNSAEARLYKSYAERIETLRRQTEESARNAAARQASTTRGTAPGEPRHSPGLTEADEFYGGPAPGLRGRQLHPAIPLPRSAQEAAETLAAHHDWVSKQITALEAQRDRYGTFNPIAAKLTEEINALEAARFNGSQELVALPLSQRGRVQIDIDPKAELSEQMKAEIEEGKEIVAAYVHPDLLPHPIQFELGPTDQNSKYFYGRSSRRPSQPGKIRFNPTHGPAQVAHEIVHGIEDSHPEILAAARAFLLHRAAGEAPVDLFTLTGDPDDRGKLAYKDRWEDLGGNPYSGRLYDDGAATEILTQGLTRLHKDPVAFARDDPEYFSFVVKTLRKW